MRRGARGLVLLERALEAGRLREVREWMDFFDKRSELPEEIGPRLALCCRRLLEHAPAEEDDLVLYEAQARAAALVGQLGEPREAGVLEALLPWAEDAQQPLTLAPAIRSLGSFPAAGERVFPVLWRIFTGKSFEAVTAELRAARVQAGRSLLAFLPAEGPARRSEFLRQLVALPQPFLQAVDYEEFATATFLYEGAVFRAWLCGAFLRGEVGAEPLVRRLPAAEVRELLAGMEGSGGVQAGGVSEVLEALAVRGDLPLLREALRYMLSASRSEIRLQCIRWLGGRPADLVFPSLPPLP